MRRWSNLLIILTIFLLLPSVSDAVVRTSIGVVGGAGIPTGWWADRWGLSDAGEINLRYEISPGMGILLSAGLSKAYLAELSVAEVAKEAQWQPMDDFNYTITTAKQGGSFKSLPVGFGLYRESQVGTFRPYGSASMMVFLWKFDRSQVFHANNIDGDTSPVRDNWYDTQDGANLGAQFVAGTLYQIRPMMLLDASLAFHWLNIGTEHGSLAYWGYPVRTWDDDRINEGKGSTNYLQFRIGLRYGR
jgi:hypothetical protein